MIKPFNYPKAVLTVSALLALTSFQGLAFANDARIQMDGEITGATCLLAGSQNGTGADQSATNMSLNLGSGNLTKITTAPTAIETRILHFLHRSAELPSSWNPVSTSTEDAIVLNAAVIICGSTALVWVNGLLQQRKQI